MDYRCTLCSSPLCSYLCSCTNPATPLCLDCMDLHLEEDKDHAIKKLRLPKPALPSSADSCSVCSLCKAAFATILCCCSFPPAVLCQDCKATHVRKNSVCVHPIFPLEDLGKIRSIEDSERVKIKVMQVHMAEERLRQNLLEFRKCEESITLHSRELISVIETRRNELLTELRRYEQTFVAELERAVLEAKQHILVAQFQASNELTAWISQFDPMKPQPSTAHFTFQIESKRAVDGIALFQGYYCLGKREAEALPEVTASFYQQLKTVADSTDSEEVLRQAVIKYLDTFEGKWDSDRKTKLAQELVQKAKGEELKLCLAYFSVCKQTADIQVQLTSEIVQTLKSLPITEIRQKLTPAYIKSLLGTRFPTVPLLNPDHETSTLLAVAISRLEDLEPERQLPKLSERIISLEKALQSMEREKFCISKDLETANTSTNELRETIAEESAAHQAVVQELQVRIRQLSPSKKKQPSSNPETERQLNAAVQAFKEVTSKNEYLLKEIDILKSKLAAAERDANSNKDLQRLLEARTTECQQLQNLITKIQKERDDLLQANAAQIQRLQLEKEELMKAHAATIEELKLELQAEQQVSTPTEEFMYEPHCEYEAPTHEPRKMRRTQPYANVSAPTDVLHWVTQDSTLVEANLQTMTYTKRELGAPGIVTEGTAMCYMTKNLIFGCGGRTSLNAFTIRFAKGNVRYLACMRTERAFPGIVATEQNVYVFGGLSRRKATHNSCERYSVGRNEWTDLPNMFKPHSHFTPCLFNKEIYIVGRSETPVEVLNLATEKIRELNVSLYDPFLVISDCDQILAISEDIVTEWDTVDEPIVDDINAPMKSVTACGLFTVTEDSVAFHCDGVMTCYVLDLGELNLTYWRVGEEWSGHMEQYDPEGGSFQAQGGWT